MLLPGLHISNQTLHRASQSSSATYSLLTILSYIQPPTILSYIQPPTILSNIQPPTILSYIQPPTIISYIQPPTILRYIQPPTIIRYIQPPTIISYLLKASQPSSATYSLPTILSYIQPPNHHQLHTASHHHQLHTASQPSSATYSLPPSSAQTFACSTCGAYRSATRPTASKGPARDEAKPSQSLVCVGSASISSNAMLNVGRISLSLALGKMVVARQILLIFNLSYLPSSVQFVNKNDLFTTC